MGDLVRVVSSLRGTRNVLSLYSTQTYTQETPRAVMKTLKILQTAARSLQLHSAALDNDQKCLMLDYWIQWTYICLSVCLSLRPHA